MVELALACLHKLVAHAWLHGESTAAGTMDILSAHGSLDDDDTVANVIKIVIKCGETTNEAQQLAVVRALLTFTTAGGCGGMVGGAAAAAAAAAWVCSGWGWRVGDARDRGVRVMHSMARQQLTPVGPARPHALKGM